MSLAYKQLTKEIGRNKIFVSLLFLLTALTSLMFFFIIFSIDGNMAELNALHTLTENQLAYKDALGSNTFLAYVFLVSTVGLTAFVFIMFFYRFFRANRRQIGCLKALGFKDSALRGCFVIFVAVMSVTGAMAGLIGGYFLSSVLIAGNMQSYLVTGLVKGVSHLSFIIGVGATTLVFCVTAFFCYYFVRGKEPGTMLAGTGNNARFSLSLRLADALCKIIPVKDKFPFRIALRKPLAVILIITAVMSFSVCMILGRSLNISSAAVFASQTTGHNYEFDTRWLYEYQTAPLSGGAIAYLENADKTGPDGSAIDVPVIGLYSANELFELQNANSEALPLPNAGMAYISPGIAEIRSVKIGDKIEIMISAQPSVFTVMDIAANAKTGYVYVNASELAELLEAPEGAYNGVLSLEPIPGGETTTRAERIDELNRSATSNNISAVINQAAGAVVGAILLFLALYLNFQDNTRDMLILHMMGCRTKQIRKLLINVYLPIVWAAFVLTLAPSILLAKAIQKSLSVSLGEYMPFGTDIFVILIVFALLNVIYLLVQGVFGQGVKRVIAKEEISAFVYAE
jgi:putative ABC transport system permease protein